MVLGFLALAVVALVLLYGYSTITTRDAWEEAESEAARDLPRWRLMEMEADRPAIPDEENSALRIIAARRAGGGVSITMAKDYDAIFEKLTPAAQLNHQQAELLRTELAKIAKPVEEARKLKDMRRGRFPVQYADDFIGTLIPEHQNARSVAEWLQHDAWLLAHEGKVDEAVESCQALLNIGRAFDGDPFLISHLIRIAVQHNALATLERVLAQGQPSDACLQKLQAVLDGETHSTGWLAAVRGERAGFHHFFDNIRTGKVKSSWLSQAGMLGGGGPGNISFDTLCLRLADKFPSVALKYYPEYLRHMNRLVEISKLPNHERNTQVTKWELSALDTKNPLIRILFPAMSKVDQADSRNQALLRTALVAVACERYRQRHPDKEWPASIEMLIRAELLDETPIDPFDGQPIRYRRTKEGIVVYSVGMDAVDNQGNVTREKMHEPGYDIGIRLWNADRRRQAPLPPVAILEAPEP